MIAGWTDEAAVWDGRNARERLQVLIAKAEEAAGYSGLKLHRALQNVLRTDRRADTAPVRQEKQSVCFTGTSVRMVRADRGRDVDVARRSK